MQRGNKGKREPGIFRELRERCPERRGEGSLEHAEQAV